MSGGHARQTTAKGIHTIIAYEFANEAARTANAGYSSLDIGKAARQLDTDKLYWLASVTNPGSNATPTWLPIGSSDVAGGGGGLAVVETSASTASVQKGQLLHVTPPTGGSVISTPASPNVNDAFAVVSGSAASSTRHVSIDVGSKKINGTAPGTGNSSRAKITVPGKRVDFIYAGSSLGWIATPGDAFAYQDFNPNGTELTYVSSGDTNGVFCWIGTDGKTTTYVNPGTNGKITFSQSSVVNNWPAVNLADRGSEIFHSDDAANSWAQVDLGASRSLILSRYTWQGRNVAGGGGQHPRNWKFQGSNNGSTWVDLDTQVNNTTIDASVWFVSPPISGSTAYRYFRFFQNGPNSNGQSYLTGAEMELYGVLVGA